MSNTEDRPAMTGAQRQAALRARRLKEGRREVSFWLTQAEQDKVHALLAGESGMEADKIAAERDSLSSKLEKSRALNTELLDDVCGYQDELLTQARDIRDLRSQLQQANNALKEKPAKTFVVPELPGRRAQIAKAFSFEGGWRGTEEIGTAKLKTQAELARKFSTEIKQARSRLAGFVAIAVGETILEQSKSKAFWGTWNKFDSPIVSPAEKALLLEACVVLGRIENDVERAGNDVERLHKQREAEDKTRWESAATALDAALFTSLDRRAEVLFVTAALGDKEYVGSDWGDIIDGARGRGYRHMNATDAFRRALQEAKGKAIKRVADAIKSTGTNPEELAAEIAERFRHPDTREKHGQLADQVTAYLVSEQLSRT